MTATTDPRAAFAAAGWLPVAADTTGLTWQVPDGGERYELTFLSPAELDAAAGIIARHPTMTALELVARLPAPAAPEPAPPEHPADVLPISELVVALDAHAQQLPRPLALDFAIPLPTGLPERFRVPLDIVKPGRWQPRTVFDEAELADLASSIAEHGVLNPLIVFANEHGFLELIAGERRWRASRLAGLAFVPVEVRSYTMRQVAEIAAIDNLQRADLTAVEEGAIFNRLIQELGISEVQLAKRLGRSRGNIQQKRAIASADPAIHTAVQEGRITFTVARTIIGAAPGHAKLQVKALKAVQDRLKVQKLSEADVKRIAEGLVLKGTQKELEALGWHVKEYYNTGTVVYAPGERPKVWSGAELLEAVRETRRPSREAPAAAELSGDQAEALKMHGWDWENLGVGSVWWHAVRKGYSGPYEFLSPAELAERGTIAAGDVAAVRRRFEQHGWALKKTSSSLQVKHPKGAEEYVYEWKSVLEFLAKVEGGKADTKRATQKGYAPEKIACCRCGTKTSEWNYAGTGKACTSCTPILRAEQVAAAEAFRRRVAVLVDTMEASPAREVLTITARWWSNKTDDREALVSLVAHLQGRDAATPRLEALLPPDPGAPPPEEAPQPGTLAYVVATLERIEAAGGTADDEATLEELGDQLDDLADVLDDATYEDLARRLSTALEMLPIEESEAA